MFLKSSAFLSFAKNLGRNIRKNIGNNLSSTCSHQLLDYTKEPAIEALKIVSKREISKKAKELVI